MLELEAGVSIAGLSRDCNVAFLLVLTCLCARDSEPYVIVFSTFKSCDQKPDSEAGVSIAGTWVIT